MPGLAPTALDKLVVHAIDSTCRPDGTCDLGQYHGTDLCELSSELLAYSPKLLSSRFGYGNQQRLLGALLTYRDKFAPDNNWVPVAFDTDRATVTWRSRTPGLPDVVDTITRTSRLAQVALHPSLAPVQSQDAVARFCDLTNPKESLLWFPDENLTVPWCVADDPIWMRELAFPADSPRPTHDGGNVTLLEGRLPR